MTAQPLDHSAPGPIDRPRTVGAIRHALPPDRLDSLGTAFDASAPEELFAVAALWAAVAQTATDPDIEAASAAVRAGTAVTYGLGDIFPALTGVL